MIRRKAVENVGSIILENMKGVILLNENMHALGYENPLTLAGGC